MDNWVAVLIALSVPVATFLAAWTSQRKAMSKEYLLSVEQRVTRLELDLKACENDLKACDKERSRLVRDNFQLMQEVLRMTSLLRENGLAFHPPDTI